MIVRKSRSRGRPSGRGAGNSGAICGQLHTHGTKLVDADDAVADAKSLLPEQDRTRAVQLDRHHDKQPHW
jgi:hypothetical protein